MARATPASALERPQFGTAKARCDPHPELGVACADPRAVDVLENSIERATPLGRIGELDHIARTVLFPASDDASHVQGQEPFVDGGVTASPSGAPI